MKTGQTSIQNIQLKKIKGYANIRTCVNHRPGQRKGLDKVHTQYVHTCSYDRNNIQ